MSCIENYNYEILFKGSFKECSKYIKENFKNIRYLIYERADVDPNIYNITIVTVD